MSIDLTRHWDQSYATGGDDRSWFEPRPSRSLEAIEAVVPSRDAPILDVGGGASRLAGALLAAGHTDVTVLDLSAQALRVARDRLGRDAARVEWIVADLLAWRPARGYVVWHDRAVLHFFIEEEDRRGYARTLRAALAPGGHAVIATFAPGGPEQCSGLPVRRSSATDVLALLGDGFALVKEEVAAHRTPAGDDQLFTWVVAQRRSAA